MYVRRFLFAHFSKISTCPGRRTASPGRSLEIGMRRATTRIVADV
jgi:hypothetical protein